MDSLTTRTLGLNVYRDFPRTGTPLSPYLGIGVGVSNMDHWSLTVRIKYQLGARGGT